MIDVIELALFRNDNSKLIDNINSITGKNDTNLNNAIAELAQQLTKALGREDALIENAAMEEYYNNTVTEVKYYGFVKSNIKVIKLPNVIKIDNSAFDGINDSNVEEIYIPNCVTYGTSSFQRNPKLRIVDFGKGDTNTNGRISNCPLLTTLIFRNEDRLISPTNASSIVNCPFASDGTGGYIYVPQSMIERYEASSGWQQFGNVLEFKPIEGSIYELTE